MKTVTVITGASSGLGRAITLQLAEKGGTFYLLGQNLSRLEEVAEKVQHLGAEAVIHACDLTQYDEVSRWFQSLLEQEIIVEALYHCIARNTFGEILNQSMDDLDWVYQTNLVSTAHWISMVYPGMAERGSGTIVLMSSLSAYAGYPMATSYAASKRAMLALEYSLLPEAKEAGIHVHFAYPGFIKTRIFTASRYRNCQPENVLKTISEIGFPMMSPEKAATWILREIEKGKTSSILPYYAKIMAFIGLRAPWLIDFIHRQNIGKLQQMPVEQKKPLPHKNFQAKHCVVTGAGSGIGKELTLQLVTEGAHVYGLDVSAERLQKLEATVTGSGSLKTLEIDISNRADMEAAAQKIHQDFIHIDLLINNAGITLVEETAKVSFAQWKQVLDINYLGTLHGIHFFYPAMVKRGAGHIANIASVAGHCGYTTAQAYAASKGAVVGFTRSLEVEARNHGVLVSYVCPSYVSTSIFNDAMDKAWTQEKIRSTFLTKPVTSRDAAKLTLQGLRKGKKTIVYPFTGRFLFWITTWFPGSIGILQKRILRKFHAARPPE